MWGGNRRRSVAVILVAGIGLAAGPSAAWAGVDAWRVNEVYVDPAHPATRYVELAAPASGGADNCWFPSTRLEVLDASGAAVGQVAPFAVTTCFNGEWYLLFATSEAVTSFGVQADAPLPVGLAAAGGQVCVRSSTIRYDCARWGAITGAVGDQQNPGDQTVGPALPGGAQALVRVADTGVVATDFSLGAPTPRGPNDGTPWSPPDAGPTPDAAPMVDAAPPADAEPVPDAGPTPSFPDARASQPPFLNADPGGGGCDVGGRGAGWTGLMLVLLALTATGARRTAAPRASGRGSDRAACRSPR
jgi:hypothetical protein